MLVYMSKAHIQSLLEQHGLRNTRQRIAIADLLLGDGEDKHVTAEWVAEQLASQDQPMALATVYNTLNSFVDAGLLRQLNGAGDSTLFDTNTRPHHHFLNETSGELTDIETEDVKLVGLPPLPEGKTLSGVDVVIRIK